MSPQPAVPIASEFKRPFHESLRRSAVFRPIQVPIPPVLRNLKRPQGRAPVHRPNAIRFFDPTLSIRLACLTLARLLGLLLFGGAAFADTRSVSFFHDVVPILKKSCTGCHHPGKMKGDLDLTTYNAFKRGGKSGEAFKPGDPKASLIIDEITGDEPSMPKEGDPLSSSEIEIIQRWIAEGAKDDTPATAHSFKLTEPPAYTAAPVLSALAYSPDGNWLAVSGYHELLIHKSDGSELAARLLGESTRIDSVQFSPDGKMLGVAASAPAQFGEIQVWDFAKRELKNAYKVALDSVYGISFSPDGQRAAVGCADKTVRVIGLSDGKELLRFDNHSDWVLGTTFTLDGKRLLSGGRDRALKLIDATSGQFIDDVNKLLEEVLCLARHPKADQVAYGGAQGTPRLYKISDNQGRTSANNDVNLIREFERLPGPVYAVAFSSDGQMLAVAGAANEARIYRINDGSRVATLKGHEGALFAIAFHPSRNEVATGGFDGKVRIYDSASGSLKTEFVPVPIRSVAGK